MKEQDRALAEKVLDYWFTMEFLAQDPFPDHPELINRVKKRKQNPPGGREKSTPIIEDFLLLRGSSCRETLYEVIAKEARACGMKKWGNLTIYIGKVRREKCIDRIAEVLPFTAEDGAGRKKIRIRSHGPASSFRLQESTSGIRCPCLPFCGRSGR